MKLRVRLAKLEKSGAIEAHRAAAWTDNLMSDEQIAQALDDFGDILKRVADVETRELLDLPRDTDLEIYEFTPEQEQLIAESNARRMALLESIEENRRLARQW